MRANEIHESAVEELKNKLPKLKSHTYKSIDSLMKDISFRHKITGKKLHDLFVKKYGHTPDTWIKRIKNKLGEEDIQEGQVIQMKPRNPLNKNLIIQLKALSATALELFWEGSYVPTAVQGQIAQLSKEEQNRMFKQNEAQFKALGYEYSIHEEDSDILRLHSIAREAWYDAEKPMSQYRGLPDLEYNKENNSLHVIDLIGDDDEGVIYDKTIYEADISPKKYIVTYQDSNRKYTVLVPADDDHEAEVKIDYILGIGQDRVGRAVPARGTEKTDQIYKIFKDPRGGARPAQPMLVDTKSDLTEEKCPHCSGPMFSELMINKKKDACYYKVKSRYKVWPSAYASGALVKCRKKGAKNWGNKSESVAEDQLDENLRDWFKEKWVRFGPDGKIKGPCARGDDSEGKPKCLPQSKAHSLGKKGRASAAARKRREDPNPERSGKAINVATKKKTEDVIEGEVIQFPRSNTPQPKKPNLSPMQKRRGLTQRDDKDNVVQIKNKNTVSAPSIYDIYEQMVDEAANRAQQAAIAISMKKAGKKPKKMKEDSDNPSSKVFQSMGSQLIAIGKDADKIKKHDSDKIKTAIVKKLEEIDDPKLTRATRTFLEKVVQFNRNNPKTMAAIFGFTFAVIARVSMQVSHNLGLTPTQATLILEATLPTLGNFLGYIVNGFSVKDSVQAGLIAGTIGVGGTMVASGALTEFANDNNDDGDGDDREYEILHRLASQWWLGDEQSMIKAERTLASMGWEIGEDEGYDDGGVFVVRAGDVNGKSYISWPHEDLQLNEYINEDVQGNDDVQKIKDFIKWSMKTLNIQGKPKFTLSKNTEHAQKGHHTGVHSGDSIWVYIGNRNLIDIFRTIFHELVHQRQEELNMIKNGDSYPGSPIEALADMMAGKYIKIYGKEHPEIFQ